MIGAKRMINNTNEKITTGFLRGRLKLKSERNIIPMNEGEHYCLSISIV